MTPALITEIMINIFSPAGLGIKRMDYGDDALSSVIINELAGNWDCIPESTKALMLGIAWDLKVRGIDMRAAGQEAEFVVERARKRSL